MSHEESLRSQRVKKRDALAAMGVDPYGPLSGAAGGRFADVVATTEIRGQAERLNIANGERAELRGRVAGRIVLLRIMGKLAFATIRDERGTLQLGISKAEVGEQGWEVLKQLDLGDWVGGDGVIGKTKTGELTLWCDKLTVLAKTLQPPPEKWHGLTDVDLRYRRRYVDLFANPEVREVFKMRGAIIKAIRETLFSHGYHEVETPVLQPIYGGAAARPFTTHHNTLDMKLYLRISPELYLKRLLVGGLERVFEISRNFRNEGISTRHNPEFTMIELYEAYADYNVMMERTEQMVAAAFAVSAREAIPRRVQEIEAECQRLASEKAESEAAIFAKVSQIDSYRQASAGITSGRMSAVYNGQLLDFTPPWSRRKYAELLRQHAGLDMQDREAVIDKARQAKIPIATKEGHPKAHDVLVNELFDHFVQPNLIQPTFVYDYPAAICPLTRRHPDDPNVALRFEAFVAGMELGNAYTELNDPEVQRQTLATQVAGEGDETMAVMDEDFIAALEYGMPPAGGLGVGIDRLVMLLTDSPSIRDVILFPLQRPQVSS